MKGKTTVKTIFEMTRDNQKADVRCENCLFFYNGSCMRYPPKVSIVQMDEYRSTERTDWPCVSMTDFCGEFWKEVKMEE